MAVAFKPVREVSRDPVPAMARGATMVVLGQLASLARPIAVAWFARRYGDPSLGGFAMLWACLEIGARFATLGLDRALQRWMGRGRAEAALTGIVIAGLVAVGLAAVLVHVIPRLRLLDVAMSPMYRLMLLVGVPLIAMTNVALRAARGEAQIAFHVLARSVAEPLLLLAAGGVVAPPAALLISLAGGATIGALAFIRTFSVRVLAAAALRPRAWPVRELLGTAIPLGLADALQTMRTRLDLVFVAIVTLSPSEIAMYAVAAEVASMFVRTRQAVDLVVAPIAAHARCDRWRIVRILTTATRWSAIVGVPLVLAILIAPHTLLERFGGADGSTVVLCALAAGRAIELMLAPASSILAVIGEPSLLLLSAGVGMALALAGQMVVAIAGLGPWAVAFASAIGMLMSSLLAGYWLAARCIARK